jgi:hypothetical protein
MNYQAHCIDKLMNVVGESWNYAWKQHGGHHSKYGYAAANAGIGCAEITFGKGWG